jgi:hypothetical protein
VIIIGAISRKVKNVGKKNAEKGTGFQILLKKMYYANRIIGVYTVIEY